MKDRRNIGICRFLCIIFTTAVLTAGCTKDKADDLTELELGISGDKGTETTQEVPDKTKGDAGEQREKPSTVFVYVCGAVHTPGVYELDSDSRVYEALARAGGVTKAAAGEALNQARVVTDGERIYIPTAEELEKGVVDGSMPEVTGADRENGGKININTASREELKSLPGIGDSKADSIISYRESNGGFQAVEDLMQVEGIKEGVFNKIKDKIMI
ncbi:helix-hairpin-helix domain-containing protein [Clostridium sp. C105KSO13]|uniref:helix-hairpin-helix domain-containing protein n=1 Tax=Clostridium sp. C105KSO13 TaxID=1776045 RepID=UPI000740827E|nr:helix-hairpin-helix domain-containing protein [Clostridium sp. C105KSO13]CUX47677.1 ComE operon protein 1 [Clostridium sp. C105KSO13]